MLVSPQLATAILAAASQTVYQLDLDQKQRLAISPAALLHILFTWQACAVEKVQLCYSFYGPHFVYTRIYVQKPDNQTEAATLQPLQGKGTACAPDMCNARGKLKGFGCL